MKYIALIILALILIALLTGTTYHGINAGIAWSWGGIEFIGDPGIFICQGQC
jgi:hypothetical protein